MPTATVACDILDTREKPGTRLRSTDSALDTAFEYLEPLRRVFVPD